MSLASNPQLASPATARRLETALLVHVDLTGLPVSHPPDPDELATLARSAGVVVLGLERFSRPQADPRYFIGVGKVEALQARLADDPDAVVLFNHELSPSQGRNLEKALAHRVLSRTELILDIFAQRARTFEGKLQVELAQLKHQASRLVRGWTHLERQRGGIGLRGPGETQLETDRRLIMRRIQQLQAKLRSVQAQRQQNRRQRRKQAIPTVAVVGYTNAGKSTLFNRLTAADTYVADQLFATLDPTTRWIQLPPVGAVALTDTVGFIHALPHDLVAAFRATLEETQEASLLLHVVDAASEQREAMQAAVQEVLTELGAAQTPQLRVYNKIDALGLPARIEYAATGLPSAVWLSAQTGAGLDLLHQALAQHLAPQPLNLCLVLPYTAGALHAQAHERGWIQAEAVLETGWRLTLELPPQIWENWQQQLGLYPAGAASGALASQQTPP